MKLRKLIRVLHRDLGYLFFGMSIIYAISGIALNHIRDINSNFNIHHYQIDYGSAIAKPEVNEQWIANLLKDIEVDNAYKKHYFPSDNKLKVFLKNGNLELDMQTGKGLLETVRRRPVLFQLNFLHYNPGRWWKWFSDIFCVAWIIISITGLFIIKSGKHSIRKRGAVWTIAGIIIPIILLLLYS
ncbi:MAG: PepSY-associated TM helix domain-containing protein [Bacteroidales bacterium]|nr:PepSY-associated TM helix domain-containing protein [Bacteroidales bacterium]